MLHSLQDALFSQSCRLLYDGSLRRGFWELNFMCDWLRAASSESPWTRRALLSLHTMLTAPPSQSSFTLSTRLMRSRHNFLPFGETRRLSLHQQAARSVWICDLPPKHVRKFSEYISHCVHVGNKYSYHCLVLSEPLKSRKWICGWPTCFTVKL